MEVANETIVRDLLRFDEKDILEDGNQSSDSESTDSEIPVLTHEIRTEWHSLLASITDDISRDVSSALIDIEGAPGEEDLVECKMRCQVLVGASIAWNLVPLHQWRCSIYDVLSDKKNDFKAFICPCGAQKQELEKFKNHLKRRHKVEKSKSCDRKIQNLWTLLESFPEATEVKPVTVEHSRR